LQHQFVWKGSRRTVEVLFQNIREINDFNLFEARGDDWKVIVDFPFDKDNHSPADDKARIQEFEAAGNSARTLCWLPYFFSQNSQRDLGSLVTLEYVLKNDERFNSFSKHLSPVDRAQAKTLLENQRSQLRQRIKDYLMGAYGAAEALPNSLDDSGSLENQVISLEQGFMPSLPVGSDLGKAFENLLTQALNYQYPEHPEFENEVKLADLGKVFEQLRRAIHASNGRIDVDSPLRPLMRSIAQPLKLGEMHERHFIFKDDWPMQLSRALAKDEQAGDPVTIKRLRAAIDQPHPRGLPDIVQNLLIMVFAEHGQYAFTLHGGDVEVVLKDIRDDLVLVKQDLAEPAVWKAGVDNAGAVYGVTVNALRTANHQSALQKDVLAEVNRNFGDCEHLIVEIKKTLGKLNQNDQNNRLKNAEYAFELAKALKGKEGAELVAALANIQFVNNPQALAKSISSAASVTQAIQDNNWALLESVWAGADADGKAIKKRVCDALIADELVTSLAPALRQAQADATAIINKRLQEVSPAEPEPEPSPPSAGHRVVKQAKQSGLTSRQAKALFVEIEGQLKEGCVLDVTYTIIETDGSGG